MGGKRPKRSATTYDSTLAEIADVIGTARRQTARAVNAMMTASYWAIGRRIVEEEQRGGRRAGYGEELVERLAGDLTARFGRGFGRSNLWQIRAFYLAYPNILQTASGELAARAGDEILQTPSGESAARLRAIVAGLPLPWSHYVRLLGVKNDLARRFYEAEVAALGSTIRRDRRAARWAWMAAVCDRAQPARWRTHARREPAEFLGVALAFGLLHGAHAEYFKCNTAARCIGLGRVDTRGRTRFDGGGA